MYAAEQSDIGVVPKKGPNKAACFPRRGGGSGGKAGDQGKFWKVVCDLYAETGGSIERTGQDTRGSGKG
jgi:hypothetical protein